MPVGDASSDPPRTCYRSKCRLRILAKTSVDRCERFDSSALGRLLGHLSSRRASLGTHSALVRAEGGLFNIFLPHPNLVVP